MFTKFNDMYSIISDVIQSYIKDGYKIDVKESVIDHEEDKDCIFKSVLKIDVDGIECKTIITLNENEDDKSKYCTYHKVEIVGDTNWSEETYTYNYTTDKYKLNNTVKDNSISKTDNDWLADHLKRREYIKLISDKHGFRWFVNKDISEEK
jgi:hypothetical protein